MTDAAQLVSRHFGESTGELVIGGLPIAQAARAAGTPVFVYDRQVVEKKLDLLRRAVPRSFEVYYSIKANPNQAFLKLFVENGCGLEVASGGELHQALACGCEPRRIVFAGPGKTSDELSQALASGIGELHAESMDELTELEAVARKLGVRARVAVRVNPSEEAQGGAMRMGGQPTAFGFDEERLEEVVRHVVDRPCFEFTGVHLFTGTQILQWELLVRQYQKGLEIARRAAKCAGQALATVDFGGGLGIPYYSGDEELDVERFGVELHELVRREVVGPEFDGTRFIVEPGRYLVGDSGVYVTRVTAVKQSRGKTFVVVDGGMNHHLAASGNLGQVLKRNFPVAVLNRLGEPPQQKVDVVGPLCTPLDVLARGVSLPAVSRGDLIGVFQSGAYARSASPLGFLSHCSPPEVLASGGQLKLIRRRGDHDSLLEDQCEAEL